MTALRVLAAAGLLGAGLVTAVAAVAVHTLWWGLPLVVVALASGLQAVGRGWWTRLPLAAGYAVGVAGALLPPSEGGYLVAAAAPGWLLILTALLAAGYAIVTLPRPRRRRPPRRARRTDRADRPT